MTDTPKDVERKEDLTYRAEMAAVADKETRRYYRNGVVAGVVLGLIIMVFAMATE